MPKTLIPCFTELIYPVILIKLWKRNWPDPMTHSPLALAPQIRQRELGTELTQIINQNKNELRGCNSIKGL